MPNRPPSLMVPQGEEAASLSLIMEMLRGLSDQLSSQNSAAAADRKMMHDMHIRLVQIESNQLQRRVEEMAKKIDELESDRDRRAGVIGAAEWVSRFGPWLATVIAVAAAIVAVFRK